MAETRTYFAVSVLKSRTMYVNLAAGILAVLSVPEIYGLIPLEYLPTLAALTAVLNMFLRTQTVRPVVFSAPSAVTPVQVAALGPPPPPLMTD